jgi:mono/diheme cytochrome c family protein
MFPFMRVAITFVVCCVVVIFASNLSGFFTNYKDDPHWVEPASAKGAGASAASADPNAAMPGAKVYAARCVSCHQTSGKGLPGIYPALAGSEWAQGDVSRPIRIVLNGFQGKIQRGGKDYNGVMTPWKDILSDEEVAQVLTYVRASWGNTASAIEPAVVKEIRGKTIGKSGAYAEAELANPL